MKSSEKELQELRLKIESLKASQLVLELLALSLFDGVHNRPRAIKQFSETTGQTLQILRQSESETFVERFVEHKDRLQKCLFDAWKEPPIL